MLPAVIENQATALREQKENIMKDSEQHGIKSPSAFSAVPSPLESPEVSFSTSMNKNFKNVCFRCGKKTGLLGIKCRCGQNFCSKHKYAEEHECKFDYQEAAKAQLRKLNPQVCGAKVSAFWGIVKLWQLDILSSLLNYFFLLLTFIKH